MTTYWVQFVYNMEGGTYSPDGSDVPVGHGPPVTFLGNSLFGLGPSVTPSPYANWDLTSLRYSGDLDGYWQLTDKGYQKVVTDQFVWDYTIKIGASFIVGTQPDPTQLIGPTLTATHDFIPRDPYSGPETGMVSWTAWAWKLIDVQSTGILFTAGADRVNFNNLTSDQQAAVSSGADLYNALGGGDTITLPNANPGDQTVPIAGTNKTFDLTQTFVLGDKLGDTTTVTGGNGSYKIALGAGSDTVKINGAGTTKVSAGSGVDTLSISGGGTLIVNGNLSGGSATIGANSTFEVNGTYSGTITFAGADATLKIDDPGSFLGAIKGFAVGDIIDLPNLPYDRYGIATLDSSQDLHVSSRGQGADLRLVAQPSKGLTFQLSPDGQGGTDIQLQPGVVGFDAAVYPGDPVMDALWSQTNLSWVGYYFRTLHHIDASWLGHREHLVQKGWQIAPIYVGTQDAYKTDPPSSALGVFDGLDAASQMVHEDFANGSTVYLDVEYTPGGALSQNFQDYIAKWCSTVSSKGFTAGVYCTTAQASLIASLAPSAPIWVARTQVTPDVPSDGVILPAPNLAKSGYAAAAAWQYQFHYSLPSLSDVDLDSIAITKPTSHGTVSDGYIAGATLFSDANGTGKLAANDVSTTTDANGGFTLTGGTGQLIAFGGTDTSTGLPFKGQLSAPAGSTDITPLTTLLTNLASDPSAQQKILSALGLSPTLNLTTFDPIAAALGGDTDGAATGVAGAKVYDTVELIASALAGAGGTFTPSLQAAFSALASTLDGAGINLTDKTALSALITQVAQTENVTLAPGVADTVASVVAAGNAALDHILQTDQPGAELLTDVAGVELVMQGAASTAITNAAGSPVQLQAVANLFTGVNLSELISRGQSEVQNPGQDLGPIAFDGSATTDQDTVLNGTVSAIDLAGHSIAYAIDGCTPEGLTFNSDGTFSFDPRGTYEYLALGESETLSFQFTASDGPGVASTGTETITINGLNDPPVIDGCQTDVAGTITELPNTTGSDAIDSVSGIIAFADPDLTDRPTATIDSKHEIVTYQDASGHTYELLPAQIAAFENAIQITPEAGNTNTGKIDWTFSMTDSQFDFLGVGESVVVTVPIVIDDHNSGTVTQDVVVTIDGSNDNPIAVPDSNGVARGESISEAAASGVLANDSDPDIHDQLTVEAVNGRTCAVGHAVEGKYGWLTLDANGSYTYEASREDDDCGDGEGGLTQDVFKYTVSDGHGGLATSTLSIVVFEQGTIYLSGVNTTLTAGEGPYVLDGSAGGDTLKAGRGDAILIGGNGDTLIAGHGENSFLFRPNFGTNTITNFDVDEDTLLFDHSIFKNVHDVLTHTMYTDAGAVISDGHGDTVTLLGIKAAQLHLHQDDFHLV